MISDVVIVAIISVTGVVLSSAIGLVGIVLTLRQRDRLDAQGHTLAVIKRQTDGIASKLLDESMDARARTRVAEEATVAQTVLTGEARAEGVTQGHAEAAKNTTEK